MSVGTPPVEQLLSLVGDIYACALDAGNVRPTLRALRDVLDSNVAQIYTYEADSGRVLDSQSDEMLDEAKNDLYVTHWGHLDPRPPILARLPHGSVMRCHEWFDERSVSGSAFYQDFFIPHGFRWAMGGMVHNDDGTSTVVAGLRSPDSPAYESWAADALRLLLPHFQRADVLRGQLNSTLGENTDLFRVVEHLPTASLAVDTGGRVLFMNAAATAGQNLPFRVIRGHVQFESAQTHAQWSAALRSASRLRQGHSLVLDGPGGRWQLQLVAWPALGVARDAFESGLLLVTLECRTRAKTHQVARLAARAGLTPAETQVLRILASGAPVKKIAQLRGASVNTVRSQVTAIFSKTGAHSKIELLQMIQGESD